MGNSFNKYVKIELYKWSSSEFPQEYGLVYTSLHDAFKSSILRLSVNTDMVLCRVGGDMCRNHQVRCHVKITALRDSRGDCKFGEVVVSQHGDINPTVEEDSAWFKFWCEDGGAYIFLNSVEQKLDRNMERTFWEFGYSYDVGDRVTLKYFVSIRCNKKTGLSVEFSGPFMYKGFFEEKVGLPSQRVVPGEPPKELTANAESEFKGKKYTLLKKNQNGCTLPSARPNFNGAILKNVLFLGEGRVCGGTDNAAETVAEINTAAQAMEVIYNNIGGHPQGNFNGPILFPREERGCDGTEASVQGTKVTVNNTGGHFHGNGNGSRYKFCYVVMNNKAPNATN